MKKKLVVLSGPSCVGKGPLRRAVHEYHPEIKFAEMVLCNSRRPRLKADTKTYEVMKAKLERRGEDPPHKIGERARSAFLEMQSSSSYTDIIVNHAGEDDQKEWSDPLGAEAQRVLDEFVKILKS